MALPTNNLQQVQLYCKSTLGYLQNYACFISTANNEYMNFQTRSGSLGNSVGIQLPFRFVGYDSLVSTPQATTERIEVLAVDKQYSVPYAYSAQQLMFNVEEYINDIGEGAVKAIAAHVEGDVAKLCETAPYRFYGNGFDAIDSPNQLAQALALYRTYGCDEKMDEDFYLDDMSVPQILSAGLNQFVPSRNESWAESWMVTNYDNAKFYRSNRLPVHTAGSVGDNKLTLTVVSTNSPDGSNITEITFSGAPASDSKAIVPNDRLMFLWNVEGQANVYYSHFIDQSTPSAAPVQVKVVSATPSDSGGNVTVQITPPLVLTAGSQVQNINTNIVAGMKARMPGTSRQGMIVGSKALYVAMPALPIQSPYDCSSQTDPDTGVSMRLTYGSKLGENVYGFWHDVIWGKMAVPEYLMTVNFPVSSAPSFF